MQVGSIDIGEDNIQALENFSYYYPDDKLKKGENGPDFWGILYLAFFYYPMNTKS